MAPRPFKRRAAQPDPAEPEVAPGRRTEVPTADASGMERRAFGEFTSPRGELASYAFGWVTGAEPHEARVTIGIGAGNPGGGSFHAGWMRHWLLGTWSIQTPEVFERAEPVLLVSHDADDGMWQLIGTSDAGTEGEVGRLHHLVDEDPTLAEVLDLAPGEEAVRDVVGGAWTRTTAPPEPSA